MTLYRYAWGRLRKIIGCAKEQIRLEKEIAEALNIYPVKQQLKDLRKEHGCTMDEAVQKLKDSVWGKSEKVQD